jgi:hypothetical protein
MNHDHWQGGMGKHMLLMLICCLVPIALIAAVSVLGLSLGPLQPLVPYVAALMCPLMMIVMMRGMMQGQGTPDPHVHHTTAPKTADKVPNVLASSTAPKTETASTPDKCH